MRISIIIITYNRYSYLKRLIKDLEKQSYSEFEVIIVNGPSTDETRRITEFYPTIKYTETKKRNISYSRNIGLQMAEGECVFFIDDDALPCDSEWLQRFVNVFISNPEIKAIAGSVKIGDSEDYEFYDVLGGLYGKSILIWPGDNAGQLYKEKMIGDYPYKTGQGCNMGFRKEELIGIGGFDEFYTYYLDETDVFCRFFKHGYETKILKGNYVRHYKGPSVFRGVKSDLDWLRIGRSTSYFGVKNGDGKFFFKLKKVIRVFMTDKAFEIYGDYRMQRLPLSLTCIKLFKYFIGGFMGIVEGVSRKRTLVTHKRSYNKHSFIIFNPGS